MNEMMSKALVILWCVVVCGSRPHDSNAGLQNNENERHKLFNQHLAAVKLACTITGDLKRQCNSLTYVKSADPSILNNPGFLENLEKVFKPEPARNKTEQSKITYSTLEENSNLDYNNENNSGIDLNFQSKDTIRRIYNTILQTTSETPEESSVKKEVSGYPTVVEHSSNSINSKGHTNIAGSDTFPKIYKPVLDSTPGDRDQTSNGNENEVSGYSAIVQYFSNSTDIDATTLIKKTESRNTDTTTEAIKKNGSSKAQKLSFYTYFIFLPVFILFI